jgi:peptidyl-tRNA hydrolase
MSMIRQTVLIREDLQFPTGLLAAQVAHIHALPLINEVGNETPDPVFMDWTEVPYLFVHGVPNKETLDYLIRKAGEHDVPVLVWRDTVYLKVGDETVPFEDVTVGASLGPCDSDKIKMVIGTLDLLR